MEKENHLEKAKLVHHNPGVWLGDTIIDKPSVLSATSKQLSQKLEHSLTLNYKITEIDPTYAHVPCGID